MKIIGIAGGSGSGKSTLAVALCRKHPGQCAVVHLDDYFVRSADAPRFSGHTNWEHPDAIRFGDLHADLLALKRGESIEVSTKSELYNPGYDRRLKNRRRHTIRPTEVLIVEGYLEIVDRL